MTAALIAYLLKSTQRRVYNKGPIMAKEKENQNRYFPHDIEASSDEKFTVMNYFFRRIKENNLDAFIDKSLLPYAAYGLFWKTVEHLHKHTIQVDKLCFLADEWRIDEEFFKLILEKFDLFEKADGEYISKRVLKNLEEQKKRSQSARERVNKRWQNEQPNPHQRTEEEKTADNQAEAKMRKDGYSQLHIKFQNDFEEYRKLRSSHQLQALDYFKQKLNSIPKTKNAETTATNMMLEYIKGGFQDDEQA